MELPHGTDIDELQGAANYVVVNRDMKKAGKSYLIWGAILLAIVAMDYRADYSDKVLIGLGALFILYGLWACAKPSPTVMICGGVMTLLSGIWLLSTSVYFMAGGASFASQAVSIIFGGFLMLGSIHEFARGNRYRKAALSEPSPVISEWLEAAVEFIPAASLAAEKDIIAFEEMRSNVKIRVWSAAFLDEGIIAVSKMPRDVVVAKKDEVKINLRQKPAKGKDVKFFFQLAKSYMQVTMTRECFARLDAWYAGGDSNRGEDHGARNVH